MFQQEIIDGEIGKISRAAVWVRNLKDFKSKVNDPKHTISNTARRPGIPQGQSRFPSRGMVLTTVTPDR